MSLNDLLHDYGESINRYLNEIYKNFKVSPYYHIQITSILKDGDNYQVRYLVSDLTINLTSYQEQLHQYFLSLFNFWRKDYNIDNVRLKMTITQNQIELHLSFTFYELRLRDLNLDVLYRSLYPLSYQDVKNTCLSDPELDKNVCQEDKFWLNKIKYEFDEFLDPLPLEVEKAYINYRTLWSMGLNIEQFETDVKSVATPTNLNVEKVRKVSCGRKHMIYMDVNYQLWGYGTNYYGQLGSFDGVGELNYLLWKRKIKTDFLVIDFVCFQDNTILLDDNGSVWSLGEFNNEVLNVLSFVPALISIPTKVKRIACGYLHIMAVDENGDLWGIGYNDSYEVGVKEIVDVNIAVRIDLPIKVKLLACGHKHTIITDQEDNVWTFGSNKFGQLGIGPTYPYQLPTKLDIKAKFIACGRDYAMLIDLEDNLYGFGLNNVGQLGFEYGISQSYTHEFYSSRVDINKKVKYVTCGDNHTLIIDEDDKLWGCGSNTWNKLAVTEGGPFRKPIEIPLNHMALSVACGENFSMIVVKY